MPLDLIKRVILTVRYARARIPHHGLWCSAFSRYRARRKQKKSERDANSAGKDGVISFENEIEGDPNPADKDGAMCFEDGMKRESNSADWDGAISFKNEITV